MRTDELISMLATGADPVDDRAVRLRQGVATACGVLGTTLLMATLLGVRNDIAQAAVLPMFWFKLAYVVALAAASLGLMWSLARPGGPAAAGFTRLAVPIALMWALAGFEWIGADHGERLALLYGRTWRTCPWAIAALSLPVFAAMAWAMRGFAPTRLRLAGGAMGLASGAVAAVAYSLHCPEMGAPFLGVWYLAGMLVPATVGWAIGPRLLRW